MTNCPTAPAVPPIRLRDQSLRFDRQVHLMGIVNTTPDSFSDGGSFLEPRRAIDHAHQLVDAGATIIDIGGESTRPGAEPVDAAPELDRVLPVIEALSADRDAIISVDTTKSEVATAALDAGAHLINDISGLGFDPNMAPLIADRGCGLVIMHIQGRPRTMQDEIHYSDLIADIRRFFQKRIQRATAAGVHPDQIIIDPGIGFGKEIHHNYTLIRRLGDFRDLGHPILVGPSRKSFLGALIDRPADQRLMATASAVACAVMTGAHLVRVHDVDEIADVLRVAEAVRGLQGPPDDP